MKTLKLAVIGLDLSHPKVFAPLFKQRGVEIHSIVSPSSDAAAAFAADTGCRVFSSPDDLWKVADEIDGLMLANITSDRHVARRFLERGIPTYFDKHLGKDAAAARDILDSAKKGNAPVLSGSVRRFAPAFSSIQNQIQSGNFGKPVIVHRFEPYPPTPGSWQDREETSGGYIVNSRHSTSLELQGLPGGGAVASAGGLDLEGEWGGTDVCGIESGGAGSHQAEV